MNLIDEVSFYKRELYLRNKINIKLIEDWLIDSEPEDAINILTNFLGESELHGKVIYNEWRKEYLAKIQ